MTSTTPLSRGRHKSRLHKTKSPKGLSGLTPLGKSLILDSPTEIIDKSPILLPVGGRGGGNGGGVPVNPDVNMSLSPDGYYGGLGGLGGLGSSGGGSQCRNTGNEDGVYWEYDSPKATEALRKKLRKLEENSPTTNNSRKKLIGRYSRLHPTRLRHNSEKNDSADSEEKAQREMIDSMEQIYQDILKEQQQITSTPKLSHRQTNVHSEIPEPETDIQPLPEDEIDFFGDDEQDSFLVMASQAVENTPPEDITVKEPFKVPSSFKSPSVSSPGLSCFKSPTVSSPGLLQDDSFDCLLSQMPITPEMCQKTRLKTPTLKRHGSSDDAQPAISTPKTTLSLGGGCSWKRNNSDPLAGQKESQNPMSQRCSSTEIERKKSEALKKRELLKKKGEIERKKQEAIRRRNLSQMNNGGSRKIK